MDNTYAIFSDLHLGVHQNSSIWHKIALDWSDWFIGELNKKGIKKILFLGDYFHSRSEVSVNTLHVASDITHKFKDFEMKMIVGNHCSFLKEKSDIHSLSVFRGGEGCVCVEVSLRTACCCQKLQYCDELKG